VQCENKSARKSLESFILEAKKRGRGDDYSLNVSEDFEGVLAVSSIFFLNVLPTFEIGERLSSRLAVFFLFPHY
jgi:hypothetical protein